MLGLMIWSQCQDHISIASNASSLMVTENVLRKAARILHLDEVLTMLARMAAATGDRKWIDRYEQFGPELDRLIHEVRAAAPSLVMRDMSARTDEANRRLVEMEEASFKLVRLQPADRVQLLLGSPEYLRQKQIYAAGMEAVLRGVQVYRNEAVTREADRLTEALYVKTSATGIAVALRTWPWSGWPGPGGERPASRTQASNFGS